MPPLVSPPQTCVVAQPQDTLVIEKYFLKVESSSSLGFRFRKQIRGSWSALALNKTPVSILADQSNRCSVLLALDIHAYRPGASLVVEGAVGRAIYKHWLETMVLLRWEPLPGRSSIIMMDHCSTHAQIMYVANFGASAILY